MWKLSTTIKNIAAEPRTVLRVPSLPKTRNDRDSVTKLHGKEKARPEHQGRPKPHAPKAAKWESVHNWHIPAAQISHRTRGAHPAEHGRRDLPRRVTSHPGEVLVEEFLKPFGLSVNGLAAALQVPATRVGAIVKGDRSVTPDTALRLGRFFGNSPEFWINLQVMHDLTRARQEFGRRIEREVRPRVTAANDEKYRNRLTAMRP